jgi:hypothetical protein
VNRKIKCCADMVFRIVYNDGERRWFGKCFCNASMTLQTCTRLAPGRKLDRAWVAYSGQLGCRSRFGVATVDHRGEGGIQMHLLRLLTVAAFLVSGSVAVATPLWVDLDNLDKLPVIHGVHQVDLAAPNVQFQGQTIAMDFSFLNSQFIRLFTATNNSFFIDVLFRINNAPLPALNFAGSGFLTDNHGAELGPTITLQAFPVTDLGSQTGVDLLLRPVASNAVPGDAYGFHLDLTLPDSPGFGFGDGPPGGVTFDGNIFGIGPGVPRDIVPDFGSTALFLTIALGGLIFMRAWVTSAG